MKNKKNTFDSRDTFTLIKQVITIGITSIILFLYFTLYSFVKHLGLPKGATIMIQIAIIFAIIFSVIISILVCIYGDEKLEEEKRKTK